MSSFSIRILFVLALISACRTSFFRDGFDHHYVYKAKSDFLGMHNVTTIIKFHVQRQNVSEAGNHVNVLWLDSFVQFSQAGEYADNPMQWNLSRPFLFTVSPRGIVLHVFVHPEEQDEVSTLKKVISSTFSANVIIKNDTQWTYSSTDNDHIGVLSHEYSVKRTGSGLRLTRYHRSVEHVERIHAKTMHLDNFGTVESVEGEDSIILENRLNSDFETKRIPYPEEYVIKTTEEGDIGVIKANAAINVKLLSKRRTRPSTRKPIEYNGLRLDKVLYQKNKIQKHPLASLEANIKAAITCSHQYTDKSNTNRTICVNNLRQNITALNEMDYESLVSKFLSKVCDPNDTKCEDERFLFIDIVAREGDDLSQKLIVKYALQEKPLDEEAIRRALIHFTTLVKPIPETVAAVEKLCFGENNEHHGSVKMTLTAQRACLALGVLVKALSNIGNDTEATVIMDKLHRWLYKQGDETPEHLRPRRSTINVDVTVSSDHLLSKFVLLHSLGNAAQPSSLPHLHEYAKPNSRIPAWRRAALSAMKYDKSNKTAQVLLDSLTFEKTETVRATAMEQFLAHPLQHNFTKSLSDILLSQNYSYPTVVRLKRAGDLNDVLLEFKVELPEVHWGKSVGNAKVGASFGIDMVNRMHLRIKPLSGFFHINIWDRVYAEAHVGILGIHVDILRIEACYRGKLEYNLNILKDFSYGEAQRDFDEYDQAASAIVSPIVNAVDGISEHFKKQSGHQSVFKPLTDSVKDIPVKARMFLDSSLALLSVLDSYQGIALVSRAKLLAFKVQGLAEDIKADTLNFYNEIADTALIVLPHAETQITEASNMMIDAQKKLGSEPQQAFETINMAKQRIKKATYQIIKAKSAIQNALSPHGGSLPTWISSQDELKMAISAAQALLTETKSLRKYFEAVTEEDIDNFVNWQGLTDIQTAVERVVTDMENLRADVEPFHVVVTDTLLKMQKIKLSVDKLDKKTKETQNNVKKSFGPKFNLAFPAQRRETDSRCGRGVWPSYTGGRYDDTPGIDVIVEEREKVVCPVNGKVFRTCEDDEVRIVPFDENFKMFTILIRNIRLEDSISANGSEFKAGQTLGHGKGKSGCSDPYIHVAMRKNAASGASTCSYVDPSSYVDNIKPFPKWQEECKEFIFKHIGNVIEAGLSGLGFEEIVEELAKRAMAWAGAEMVQKIVTHFPKSPMAKIAGTMAFAYLSQYNAEIGNAFMQAESQSELMDKKCEEMKKATTTPPTTSVEPPKQSFSTGKQEVNKVLENLQGDESLQRSRQAIHDVINRLNSSSSNIKLDDMSSMAFSRYGKILHKLNIPYKGGKQSMETTIQMLTWNVCPTFENGIAQGYGHLCVPTDGCFGLNCTIRIPDGIRKETVTLGVLFNRSDLTFTLFTTNYATEIAVDGTRKQHNVQNIMPGYDVTLFSHTNMVNISVGKAYQLTVSVVPCDTSAKCLPEVHIFHNLTFLKHQQQRQIRSSGNGCSFSADVGIQNVGHIGGSLELDKSGHVSGGGVDLGVKAGNVNIDGGFHMNNQGEWGADVGADVDLGDGKSVGTEMYLEGKGDDLTLGLGIEAQLGQSGSIGGFIEGNTDGELSAGISGQVNIGNSNISGSGYIHHDKNGTSGGGMVAANINGKGQIAASLNASSDGKIDAEIRGSAQIGNSTISGAGYIHHNQNGTSGGGIVGANINGKGQIAASLNASSDGTINAGVSGSAHIGNSTISGTGYIHHDRNGTSGGGMVAANINGKGQIAASLNASSDGTIDAGASGSAQIGNSTISGAGYIHHDQNGTSGGGMVGANINGKGQIAASLNASSDGSIDAGASGSAQIGNSTISGAGYIHHDQNGTSGGGMVGANINGKGQIAASVNASSDGTIDAGASGSAHIGNSTISGTGYIHHDKNGTSGGGMGAANINGKGQIAASLNASSDGSIDAGASGSAQIGNSTISGAGYIHHDQNGTSGGGMVGANINGKGQIAASVNASSDGTIDAGASGSAHIGNSTISGTGYIHHDKNGTSGGGMGAANINGKGQIAGSLNASSDGTIDTGASGSAQIGNSTISGAGYIHHDQNGTSGGGMVGANINGKGQIAASLNASSDGSIDAGAIGSAQIGNSTISGAGYIHHDENGTSGGGMVGANINGKGQIAASVNASSDGTIDAGASGSAHIGNSTISGTGYIHHDKNGTSGGGMGAANINGKGQIAASLNASSDGSIDAGASGSAQIGNSTISGAGYIHHDQNGTSGGGMVGANINGKGQIAASVNASSDGTIDAGASGSAHIGNSTISGTGYIHHDKNGTSGGGMGAANINGKGQIAGSLNASSDGTIDTGASGSAQIGNSTISGAGYIHHDQNGTSGGGMVGANINGKGQIAASLNASSDGSIDAGAIGSAQIGNSTISGAGYIHHDENGTSGGGMVGANINGKGQIAASVNASSDGTIDAGASGSAHIGNSTISGTGYIHHDKNGTSGGGMAAANINGKGQIAASLNASSDGTIDAGASGSAQIGNSTISGAGYIHHDQNGTSGGGMVGANINGKGQIAASLNASSDGKIDTGASGSAQIGNSTISGAGYIHHDKNCTSGGGMVAANINGKGQIAASLNASSEGTIDAGASGSAQIGNSTFSGAGYIHHDQNGTSGGGMVGANINGKGQIAASLNASSDGSIDAGAIGSAQIGNSTISGAGYIHHDQNGTSGSALVGANINGKGKIAASVNASSDGTIDAGASGSAHIGNSTISGTGYIHHDKNGTSGGGMAAANINGKGQIAASLNASSDGTIDAGASGSAHIGNSTISGTGYIHHDKNGTSGGGMAAANINDKGQIAASLNASSDGTIDAGASGSAQIGNSTISGAGYIHHDQNGTNGGGMVGANINGKGQIAASVNASSDGTIDAGASGSAHIGNSTISGTGYIHHDQNGTSGGGMAAANINGEGQIAASLNASSDGTIDARASGSALIGNSTISGTGDIYHDKNGTSGSGVKTDDDDSIHILKTRSANKCSVGLSANVGENGIGIDADANIPGFGKVGAHVTFKDGQIQGDLKIGDFSLDLWDAQKLTMDTFNQLASDLNINSDTTDVMSGFREGMQHEVCTSEMEITVGYETETMEEDFPARDRKDGVIYKDKHTDITIFKLEYTFGVGPIGIKLAFGAGGAIGTSMWSDIHANKGTAAFSIGPWVSGMVWGGLSIELGIASGGLKLIGYILKTKFPVTMETKSNKHPLTVVMNIDLELTPIELSLRGWAKVFFAKVFDKCLWKWACPPITWNILRKELENRDKVPPQFVNGSFCGNYRGKRSNGGLRECSVRQIPNRHPSDTAFQLEVSATDDDSSVKTWYAIGTSQGGKDVQGWTKFKGDNQVVPCKLPNGVPLSFTIKAQNQQGLESYLHCKLDTYDNTLPDGRVEASYKFSSHPGIIAATVIINDDSPVKTSYKALGLSPGRFGREIKDWTPLSLTKTTIRSGVSSDLRHFSSPRKGKLIVAPIESSIFRSPENCARKCLNNIKCVSFDYEQSSETCQLYDVIESHTNKLYKKGDFYNYERLGGGFSAFIEYQNQPLEHGMVYYVNVLIENTLEYRSALFSEGTLIDFTPPLTGYLGRFSRDVTVSHQCKASLRQRCEEVTDIPNHRLVVDGSDGRTVFNGNKPMHDTKYTLTNHYVTANWDGFADPESGIWGFTWAVGTTLCGQDIVQYEDPHKHISSPKYWTFSGFHEGVALQDGEYYVTVEALNNVVFGGAMVTTVCHSVPFTVDTTPPYFYNVTDVMFDEDFDILAAYYNISDRQSGISRVDFGLGTTKHDVGLRAYSRHGFMDRNDPYLVIENLELQPGIPAWVRLRAVNKVGLFASGHANAPIMVDKTPPIPGIVLDGNLLREDTEYQHDTKQICAQWQDFFDPESGIKRFLWGVGSRPKVDDIVAFRNISKFERHACAQTHLRHNATYFSTVVVLNDALNSRRSNSSSDGVLVDVTPPIPGTVDDRIMDSSFSDDIDFTSETATIAAAWQYFYDPESGIDHFDINIEVNNETAKFIPTITDKKFTDHSLTLRHLDFIKVEVSSANGAKLQTKVKSDGALVDHTPPNLHYIYDTENDTHFQSEKTKLHLKWHFSDPESGIAEYRYKIEEFDAGMKTTIFPEHGDFSTVEPKFQQVSVDLDELHLKDGALYKVHVVALNKARLSSSHVSDGVLVDTTPPLVKNVKLSMPSEEEDLDETDTYVLLASSDTLTASWLARDSESGIQTIKIGVGVARGDTSVTNGFVILNSGETHTTLHDLKMLYFKEEFPVYYYVSVKALNKAGLESNVMYSRPIKILHENVPGTVYDGRQALQDNVYTRDKTSIGISFSGFESQTCNIIGYEWAVGTEPYLTDILTFTDYGIVMLNESEGHAQISLELYESQTYYATVRARTGQMCKQEFIMSVSDGITLDSNGPDISVYVNDNKYTSQQVVHQMKSIYQKITKNIDISWSVTDMSGIDIESWSVGSLPEREDIHDVTISKLHKIPLNSVSLNTGTANFVTIRAKDKAGNTAVLTSPAIIADMSVPEVKGFSCTKVLSSADSLLKCKWSLVADRESPITSLSYGISSSPLALDVLNFTDISVERRTWFRNIGSYIVNTDTEKIYMALKIQNAADHVFITEETAVIDRTPPIKGTIQIITRETFTSSNITTRCQVSEQNIEIEVKGFKDEESGLSRLEIGLGSKSGKTDILTFAKFEVRDYIFIDELQLYPGMEVFATVRVYNKVNLYSTSFSGSMVISPSPNLSVLDGSGQNDEDYSSQLNIIQGHWKYTDRCPLISAEWSVQDLAGNVIQKFKPIINANTHFLNDELRTENDKTYINIIRTTDALNRTRLARSDGITVRIQPPKISNVRDGLENEDINYQRSVSELTGNWDEFGDNTDKNPSQVIVRYEVSVGNDRRFPNTRTNIYPFVNVGLNRTVTFKNLNLKAKLVRYYLTVRAYSAAGSYVEGYSNGVSVGYEEIVQPGDLKYKEFQSSNHSIEMGWTDFISDYGIRHYEIAVGTAPPNTTNDTVDCNIFKANNIQFDIKPLSNVGLNTFAKIEGISLSHGKRYYVTILAEDETKSCLAVTSGPILIDTSKPTIGKVFLNNKETQKRYNFINTTHLKVSLKNFSDNESGILYYHILLAEKVDCSLTENLRHVVQEKRVNITEVTFYQLQEEKQYIIKLTVINSANLSSSVTTATIFLDKISPLTGNVKAGLDWQQPISMQQSLTTLNATILIAKTQNGYTCPLQNDISPSSHNLLSTWHPLKGDYAPKCVSVTTKGLRIEVKTDEHIFTEIVKGGVETNEMEMLEGSYTFKMKGLKGHHMVSSVSISRELSSIPFNFNDSLDDLKEPSELFDNNTSYEQPQDGMNRMSRPHRYGTGFFIPGYRIRNETYTWNILFWAADMYNLKYAWITTSFDPTEIEAKYDLTLMKENDTDALTWSVIFSVNDIEKATIDTMAFQNIGKVSIIGYNKNDFVPEVDDIFNPFYSEIKLSSVHIPSLKDTPCRYGKPFFDPEVGIHEIWAGVSNSQNETETIMQYALQKRYCLPCENKCPHDCDPDCSLDTTNPLEVLHITLSNLTMLPSSNKSREISSNITSGSDFTYFSTESYYINVKVVDFAGNVEEAISEAVIIDNTPPKFIQLSCVDPIHSLDEPTLYQGTNSSVAAMWDCEDDISEITKYTTCVGSSPGVCDIKPVDNIGLKTSVLIEGLSGLLHDGSTYFVTTTAYNAADMKTSESCNITVELELPMTSQSKSTEMFSIPVANALPNVAFSDRTDRLGIHWEGKNNDTEFYEWEIGSSGTTPDIFPRVKIGTKKSTKAAIIDGHLWLDGVNINTTVKEYVLKNWTEEEIAKAHAHGNFFNFEPGRCIHVNLYSVNRAHLSSKIYVKPICMKRKEDVLMNFEQKTLQKVTAIGKMLQTSHAGVIDGKADLELTANGSAGGILVGMLKTADVDGMYGSSASDTYRSFISSPLTKSKTSRLLRNRFRRYSGMSFYISPTGYTKLNDLIEVNIRFNNTENTFVAALIYWDQDSEEWRKVTEDCKTEEHIDYSTSSTSLYTAKVCLPSHLSATQRGRRSIDKSTVVNGPRQFSLVFISKEITQTQPIIKTESLFFKEDEASVQLRAIDVFDAENDNVTFQIVDYPKNGVANITSDGQLYYKPNPDFSGNDEVIVECKETTLPQSLKPSPVHAKINLFVTEVNDAPDLLFLRDNNTFTGDRRTEIILPFESNVTEYFIGTFVASDIDRNDSLTEKVFDSSNSEANLTLSEADDLNLLEKFKSLYTKDAVTVKMYQLQLSMSKDFFGVIDYGLIVHDNAGHWSLPIKLSIGVLYNPCVFGKCAPSKNLQCTDLARAKSFDNFHCKCQPGYEGVWCETETNECSPEPCALMFDCEDLVAKFKCNINMPKLFAILICSLLAVGAVCFVVYRKKQQLNKNMKVSNIDLHDLNRYKCPQVEHFSGKYGHNVFDKEQDEQTPEFNDDVTASQTDDDSVELQEVKKSKNMLQGLPLASAGTLRPPHLKSSILTHFKSKMTPIDN